MYWNREIKIIGNRKVKGKMKKIDGISKLILTDAKFLFKTERLKYTAAG